MTKAGRSTKTLADARVLVANRGEIACRVLRTLRELGVPSVAVYSDVDSEAPHVWLADDAVALGEPRSYLDIAAVIVAATGSGATAIHPGYGFLSENPDLSTACAEADLIFVGPSAAAMKIFGDKRAAGDLDEKVGLPVLPGARQTDDADQARQAADDLGYPLLLKAAAGGGGKGMRLVDEPGALAEAFAAASREAEAAFGDGRLLLEKYIQKARHIEVQILADGKRAIAIGERECSLQRRYQKILEESPAVSIDAKKRTELHRQAVDLVEAAGYSGAGTVEFLVGIDGSHHFLEVNCRLQVEHPVTEMLTGLDLVAQQLRIAHGEPLPEVPEPRGHAIEVRINAEDPYNDFMPGTGEVLALDWPQWPRLRIDAGIAEGTIVSPHYDSLLAKMIAWGSDRDDARRRLLAGLQASTLLGVVTNIELLVSLLSSDFFQKGETFTTTIESESWTAAEIPDVAIAAAQSHGSGRSNGAISDSSDRYSPWSRLGRFRLE